VIVESGWHPLHESGLTTISRSATVLVGTVLLALARPADLAAQSWTNRVDDVRKEAPMHAGPLYARPSLWLKHIGTDSNVFNSAGDQKSDFTFTLSPQADVWVPVARRALLKTSIGTDLVWYQSYEHERSVDPRVAARGEFFLTRIMFFGESAFLNTRQRPNYEIDVRSRHEEQTLSVGTEVAVTPRLSVEVAARRLELRYDSDSYFDGTSLQRTLNRMTDGVQLVARHRLTPLTSLAVRYETLQDRFEYSPVRDSDSYRIMPGVEFKPQALLKGSAYIGYRKFTPTAAEALPEFRGLVAALDLTYTLLGATNFGASYRRDLTYSYEELQPFFIDQSVGASVRRALGRRFDLIVSADRHRYEYQNVRDEAGGTVVRPVRFDTIWGYAASVGYRFARDGRIGFGVTYRDRTSTTVRFRDYDNMQIGSSVTYGF
jgi:hypothetical protein